MNPWIKPRFGAPGCNFASAARGNPVFRARRGWRQRGEHRWPARPEGGSGRGGVGGSGNLVEAIKPAVDRPAAGGRLYAKLPETRCVFFSKLSEVGCVFFAELFQPAGKGCHYSQHHSDTKGGHGYGCRDSGLGINPEEGRRVVLGRHGPCCRGGGRQWRDHGPHFDNRRPAKASCGSETDHCRAQEPGKHWKAPNCGPSAFLSPRLHRSKTFQKPRLGQRRFSGVSRDKILRKPSYGVPLASSPGVETHHIAGTRDKLTIEACQAGTDR